MYLPDYEQLSRAKMKQSFFYATGEKIKLNKFIENQTLTTNKAVRLRKNAIPLNLFEGIAP